jgi:hypothetical protein
MDEQTAHEVLDDLRVEGFADAELVAVKDGFEIDVPTPATEGPLIPPRIRQLAIKHGVRGDIDVVRLDHVKLR